MKPAPWKYLGSGHCSPGDAEIVFHFERPDGGTVSVAIPLGNAERLQVDVAAELYVARQRP
jgi:hypothetical protein